MAVPTTGYNAQATKVFRERLGGYPSVASLPDGISDLNRIAEQSDASDRAFLRAGAANDIAGTLQVYQPRLDLKFTAKEKAFLKSLKQDVWDAVQKSLSLFVQHH